LDEIAVLRLLDKRGQLFFFELVVRLFMARPGYAPAGAGPGQQHQTPRTRQKR
jgi:hypothetical protein